MTQLVLLLLSRYKAEKQESAKSFEELQNELEDEVMKLFGRVNCNAFSLANDVTNEAVGIGLFPDGALFNHDCDPNCVVSFKGREMRVHVVKDVEVGEELTVSYVELLQSTTSRRKELKESYFFDCTCERCEAAMQDGTEDWYLDGLRCDNKKCDTLTGVVVVEEPSADGVCKRCGAVRNGEEISRYKREFESIEALKAVSEDDKWEKYQRQWEIAMIRLRMHPRNSRVAELAREIGNFLLCAKPLELQQQALKFFLAELRAVEWLLPETKLPSRGLLHFQIGKLLFEETNSAQLASTNLVEKAHQAVKHLYESLSV
ncbi:unnamed protein product [Phytophthora lilii]|uniref:Unnamed protein product n=1 Tax=Phytophthora lilii TaxID=2077276 RepID=A0A9W6WJM4_9STRA|nr:unnamed protein product [Phytophthora lilii]